MRTFNCKRMAQMISLYVAGDLAGARERAVGAHLLACEQCRRVAEEFSKSSSLLTQACTPPEFGADFYSGIRAAVLGEITRDRTPSKPSLFRRRWLYATVFAVVVIAFWALLQHGSTRRQTQQAFAFAPQVADRQTADHANGTNSSSAPQFFESPQLPRRSGGARGTLKDQPQKVWTLAKARGRQFEPVKTPDLPDTAKMAPGKQAPRAMPRSSAGPTAPELAVFGLPPSSPTGRASAPQVSRIEIQTADPNIRIIWLAPREPIASADTNHDQNQHQNENRR